MSNVAFAGWLVFLVFWLYVIYTVRFREVITLPDKGAYLVRYHLVKTPWRGYYLHHILRDDTAREAHTHPWAFTSFILWGGYYEITPVQVPVGNGWQYMWEDGQILSYKRWYGPFSIIRHKATDLHRLVFGVLPPL